MSHFTKIETKIIDLECLKKAISEMGYEFSDNAFIQDFLGNNISVELAVKMKDRYILGFIRDGPYYKIIADWWLVERLDRWTQESFTSKVVQNYAYYKVMSEVKKKNWIKVEEKRLYDGSIEITLTKN